MKLLGIKIIKINMKFVLNNLFKGCLICFVLFFSCLTTNKSIQDSHISDLGEKKKEVVIVGDDSVPNEIPFKRDYLMGLKDNESFFLSNAFLKENNFYFKKARESYAQKNIGLTNYYLNKIVANENQYGRELLAKANLFFGYVNYENGFYDLSEYNFDLFLKDYKYSHASLRSAELKYLVKEKSDAISVFKEIDEFSISGYDKEIYDFLSNKLGVSHLNLESLGFLDNSVFDIFVFNGNIFVTNILGGLLRYDIKKNNYRVYLKDKKSIFLNGIKGFSDYNGTIYIGGKNVIYYIDDIDGDLKQINVPDNADFSNVQVLLGVKNGIFVGTLNSGLWFYDLKKWKNIPLGSNKISSMCFDNLKNLLLVGTVDKAIYSINVDNLEKIEHLNFFSKNDNEKNINFIKRYKDSYFIGTYGGGLFELNLNKNSYKKHVIANNIDVNYFMDMEIKDKKLLFATFDHGLLIYDSENENWDYFGPNNGLLNLNLIKVSRFENYVILGTLNNGLVFVDENIKKQL